MRKGQKDSSKTTDTVEKVEKRPNPEVPAMAQRRRFSAKYKLRILEELDQRKQQGLETGSVLRREGLDTAHICLWRKARAQGLLEAMNKKRGKKPAQDQALRNKLKQQEEEIQRLKKQLEQAEMIIDVQKKLSRLLGLEGTK